MRRIAPIHGMTLLFLFGLICVVLLFQNQIPLWRSLLFRYVLWMAVIWALHITAERDVLGRAGSFIYDFSPVLFVILIFISLGDLIQYLRADIDQTLLRIDRSLFGVDPTVWIEWMIVPWLTDLLSFFYGIYYFLPVSLIVTLYAANRKEDFREAVFVLVFGYFISFIGYMFFPAIGPRYTIPHLQSVPLDGGFLTPFTRDILNAMEHNKRDCMPSGHTQIALMTLFLSYRFERRLFYVLLPCVCGLILSTIYLRYHYVIDLMVGATLAVLCTILAPRIYDWWKRKRDGVQRAV
jgi:membrane-associated phospholipid phosphatase